MDQSIKAGVVGFSLAVIINVFLPVALPLTLEFVPAFLAALIAIFYFKMRTFKDALVATLITYFFNDAILTSFGLAQYYNKPYPLTADASAVLSPIIEAITAIIAAYVGARLVQGIKPRKESLSPLTIKPPSL